MRLFTWIVSVLLLALLLLFVAASDGVPLVERNESISPNAVAQTRQLITANDPRQLKPGEERQLAIPVELIDEAINYLASRSLHGRASLIMTGDVAEVRLTLRLFDTPIRRYLNLRAMIREADGAPHIASAFVGNVPIPSGLVDLAVDAAVRASGYHREWTFARNAVRQLDFEPAGQIIVVKYLWQPALLEGARTIAFNPDDLARIKVAQTNLAALLDHKAPGAKIALSLVLQPLLTTTGDHSREQRRAALFVLATYLAEQNLAALIPAARDWPRPRAVMLTLFNRHDSAQHFIISSALAAWAGEPVADAIGLYKELDDARHGSGFSFADLAADRAGVRFGKLVAQNSDRIDSVLQNNIGDADLAASFRGLPEDLSEREFRRRFGGPGKPPYEQVVVEIERRLAALALYH
jgi:uncharacterized protein YfiM (DUF2279 family)